MLRELDLLPHFGWCVRPLDRLDVKVYDTFFFADRRIPRVSERTGRAVAEAGDVVLVPTDGLRLRPNRGVPQSICLPAFSSKWTAKKRET